MHPHASEAVSRLYFNEVHEVGTILAVSGLRLGGSARVGHTLGALPRRLSVLQHRAHA